MAEMASNRGIVPVTEIPTAVALARGVRVNRASTGLVAVASNTTRGDAITLTACAASEPVACADMQMGGKVAVVASEAVVPGDPAYSVASGKCSKTSANAILVGKWTTTTAQDTLGEVQIETVA